MTGELVKAEEILKLGQRVEFYVDADDTRYASRIEDITDDGLEVAMPISSKHVPVIPVINAPRTLPGRFLRSPSTSGIRFRMRNRSSHVEDTSVSENTREKAPASGFRW